jgi:glycerol-3-phosphate dehydrogenase (NAD(P)+)
MSAGVVLGAGAMGSAFCFPVADSGVDVRLIGTHLDREWIDVTIRTGIHPRVGVAFPENVKAYQIDDIGRALSGDISLVVLGVNSQGVDWAVEQLVQHMDRPIPVLMLTKGLVADAHSIRVLPDVVHERVEAVRAYEIEIGGVAGPCIAGELAARRPSSVVIASRSTKFLSRIEALFTCDYYHVDISNDVVGIEACAALKNFYAIGVGAIRGTHDGAKAAENQALMFNPEAALFSQAANEMACLVEAIGGAAQSAFGLAGIGDLYVTCQAGRNSRMGRYLGSGFRYSQVITNQMHGETVEGADLARQIGGAILTMMEQDILDRATLPLTSAILAAICDDDLIELPIGRSH